MVRPGWTESGLNENMPLFDKRNTSFAAFITCSNKSTAKVSFSEWPNWESPVSEARGSLLMQSTNVKWKWWERCVFLPLHRSCKHKSHFIKRGSFIEIRQCGLPTWVKQLQTRLCGKQARPETAQLQSNSLQTIILCLKIMAFSTEPWKWQERMWRRGWSSRRNETLALRLCWRLALTSASTYYLIAPTQSAPLLFHSCHSQGSVIFLHFIVKVEICPESLLLKLLLVFSLFFHA